MMEKKYKYNVCTLCLTYNHAPYILDAMNGFAMQETTFPVVTLIVDDASTDGEQKVIHKYLEEHFKEPYRKEETDDVQIICTKHKANANCEFVILLLKYNHYSIRKAKHRYYSEWLDNAKFHAICEGDDYWTDSGKLQKQVDFLEANPNYSVCCGGYQKKYGSKLGNLFLIKKEGEPEGFTFTCDDYFKRWYTQPLTCVYRQLCLVEYRKKCKNYVYCRDIHFYYHMLKHNNGYYMSTLLGVYRIHSGGIYSMKGSRYNDTINYLSMKELYENNMDDDRVRKALLASAYRMIERRYYCDKKPYEFYYEINNFALSVSEKLRLLFHFIHGRFGYKRDKE